METPSHSGIRNPKPQTLYLAGPTGAGKTSLALALARRLNAEIIGADAFQIYAGLPILTAQPTAEEQAEVPHHLIGCVPVSETFNAEAYARLARPAIDGVLARGRIALVVGGTGLYFRALSDGLAAMPPVDAALREELSGMPLDALVARLRAADLAAVGQIDIRNPRRVTRAIEIVETSGRPLATFRATPRAAVRGWLLTRERGELRERIAANVRAMFAAGVVEEVRAAGAGPTASRAIGFREIQGLIRGELAQAACEDAMGAASRQYAKRQLTWFRNQITLSALDVTGMHTPAVEMALDALDLR